MCRTSLAPHTLPQHGPPTSHHPGGPSRPAGPRTCGDGPPHGARECAPNGACPPRPGARPTPSTAGGARWGTPLTSRVAGTWGAAHPRRPRRLGESCVCGVDRPHGTRRQGSDGVCPPRHGPGPHPACTGPARRTAARPDHPGTGRPRQRGGDTADTDHGSPSAFPRPLPANRRPPRGAERWASAAPGNRSEARAEAARRRLQADVRRRFERGSAQGFSPPSLIYGKPTPPLVLRLSQQDVGQFESNLDFSSILS